MKWGSLLAVLLVASACTLGPQHPATPISLAPPIESSTIAPKAGPAQKIVAGATVRADWWRQFDSPVLDALVDKALTANTDLASAEASLRQARELAAAAGGTTLPQLDASYQAARVKTSQILPNPLADPRYYLYTLHTAQLSVTYPLDLFGALRSKVKSARAAAEVAEDRLVAARTTVIASLVTAVIQQAALVAQIDAAQTAIRSNRDILAMMLKRQALGDIGAADVLVQQTALANAEGVLPPLLRQLEHQRGLIATLTGTAAASPLPPLPTLPELRLPATLPVALPAAIVANRPDVRAAEAQMRGAAADVGAAIAARLPDFQLSANVGGTATKITEMFTSANIFWALMGGVTQPLFHGGQLLHQQRAAEAALDGAKAQFRGAVLTAFAEVDDALTALETDSNALDAAARADDAAGRNLGFVREQLTLGGVGTLSLLNAESAAAQAKGQFIQTSAARLSDTVALFQAVGGGIADQ